MAKKPRFNIGDTVYNKVSRRGSYEPNVARPGTKLIVEKVGRKGDTFQYTCDEYDGYEFTEDELMSKKEYKKSL